MCPANPFPNRMVPTGDWVQFCRPWRLLYAMSLKPYSGWTPVPWGGRRDVSGSGRPPWLSTWEMRQMFWGGQGTHRSRVCVCVWRGCCWKDRREREWVPVLEKMLCDLQKWGEDRELRIYMIFFLSLEKLSHTSLMWISHHNRKWEPASPIISRNLSFQRALNCRVLVIEKDVVSRVKNTCFGFVANKPYSVLVVYNKIRSLDLYKGRGGA